MGLESPEFKPHKCIDTSLYEQSIYLNQVVLADWTASSYSCRPDQPIGAKATGSKVKGFGDTQNDG